MTTTTTTTSELLPGYLDMTRLTVASFLARYREPSRQVKAEPSTYSRSAGSFSCLGVPSSTGERG
jgi:hypothetical protein